MLISIEANSLKFKSYFTVKKKDFGYCFKIRRMPYNNVIALAGSRHMCIVNYDEMEHEFEMFHFFKDIHSGKITDTVFSGDSIFSCSPKDPFVHEIRLRNKSSYKRDYNQKMLEIEIDEKRRVSKRQKVFDKMETSESVASGFTR